MTEPRCACAHNTDGSVTPFLCPVHAESDPCRTMSLCSGKRRKGTIKRGVCTNCGWRQRNVLLPTYDRLTRSMFS